MTMQRMRALRNGVVYGAHTYQRGDTFDAIEQHAQVLWLTKAAEPVSEDVPTGYATRQMNGDCVDTEALGLDEAAAVEKRPKRRYRRRDMLPEEPSE